MSTQVPVVGAFSIATVLAAQPFGLAMGTIAMGTCFAIVGVVGRAAFELQKASEGPGGMKLSKVLGWVGSGFIGAPFVTIFYLVLLRLINVQSDSIATIGLLFFGFSGPRAFTWLLNIGIGQLNKRLGTNMPLIGMPPPQAEGQGP